MMATTTVAETLTTYGKNYKTHTQNGLMNQYQTNGQPAESVI